eukprot:c26343_g1_i2 orf=633-992(+)
MAHQQSRIGIHGQGGTGASSKQFGDTTLTKVFVGGLAWETQREAMLQYFEQFGEILEAVVITDKNTGRSKGYGFVSYSFHSSSSDPQHLSYSLCSYWKSDLNCYPKLLLSCELLDIANC